MAGNLVSPNDMQEAACKFMLNGQEPKSHEDWRLCANFWAANIASGLEVSASILIGYIFNSPLTRDEIEEIAKFQQRSKKAAKKWRSK